MSLTDDLNEHMRFEAQVCPVCALLKTLDAEDSHTLRTAFEVGVSVPKIKRALAKNGYLVSEKKVYAHRNSCPTEPE